MQKITISQQFNAPTDKIFADLADHHRFGEIVGADIHRIKDGSDEINGLGSVRQIKLPFGLSFEETIVTFEPDKKIQYAVTKGSPVKSHLGTLTFTSQDAGTNLHYTIEFQPKLSVPGWGWLLKQVIEGPIKKGLKQYADALKS